MAIQVDPVAESQRLLEPIPEYKFEREPDLDVDSRDPWYGLAFPIRYEDTWGSCRDGYERAEAVEVIIPGVSLLAHVARCEAYVEPGGEVWVRVRLSPYPHSRDE